eukprot:Em0049g7a
METEVDFGSWTLVETVAWAKKAFGDDVSDSFEEEGVDGETLELLAKCGTIEQYKACGLRSIKQQMQLKRLLNTDKRELEGSSSLEREMSSKKFDRKLKLLELRTISPEDRRIYLMTRNKNNKATKETPSGSVTKSKAADSTRSVPKDDLTADTTGSITKGPASDSTVHASAPTGSVSDSTVHASAPTGPASDSTTLIDSGTTGTKSVTKDLPAKEIRSVTMNQATDSTDRESVTTGSIIHVTSNSTESVPKDIASDAIATKCNKDQTGPGPVTKELVADTAALEILSVTSPEDLDQQQEDDIIVFCIRLNMLKHSKQRYFATCPLSESAEFTLTCSKNELRLFAQVEVCSLWQQCVIVSWSQPRSGFDTPRIAVQSSAIHSVSPDSVFIRK